MILGWPALKINALFLIGVALAPFLLWALASSRWGLILRTAGESADAARAMGYSVNLIRMRATMLGGFLAGVGGSFLSLYYPGSWNEGLSSGQGITAVALLAFIAAWAIVTGVIEIAAAIRLRKEIEGEWALGLSGVLSILFGVILMARPGAGALAVVWLIGAYAVAFGIVMVLLSFKLRGLSKEMASAHA